MDPASSAEAAARALLEFQAVMHQFLDVQQQVLSAFLANAPAAVPASSDPVPPVPAAPPSQAIDARTPVTMPGAAAVERAATMPVVPAVTPVSEAPVRPASTAALMPDAAVLRLVTRIVDRPAPPRAALAQGGTIVITADAAGVAPVLAGRLRRQGHPTVVVATAGGHAEGGIVAPLDSASDATALVARIEQEQGPIAAFVHLAALGRGATWDTLSPRESYEELNRLARTLFLLAQALGPSLGRAAGNGGAAVIAATSMGGAFGTDAAGAAGSWFPGEGGVSGFVKCLAIESPGVRARTIDLAAGLDPVVAAARLEDELFFDEKDAEIGYLGDRRVGIDVVPVPAVHDPAFAITSDSVILATGGARGITADICLEIAERYQPTFVLVGQSPLPNPVEDPSTANLATAEDLKKAMIERLKAAGERVTPAAVERACQRVLKEREIRGVMGQLAAAGSRIHYVAMDVRDDAAFTTLIAEVYETYGRIDGVVHGAGIIEDKLIKDKSAASFDSVVATKVTSAFVLARQLRPETLRFVVFFTSVAGRFGNRGQADYAVANETVSKLAVQLGHRWPARVAAMSWGPWDKKGMVSPELKREFSRRGVELVSPGEGRRAFWEEIQQPASDPAEVVIAGASGMALSAYLAKSDAASSPSEGTPAPVATASAGATRDTSPRQALPLMAHATRMESSGGAARYARVIDPDVDRYLDHHRLDDKPVLPLAFATELMAEAAQATWPDMQVVAVRSLQLFKGITVEKAPVPVVISARAPVQLNDQGLMEADVEIATPTEKPPVRYRAVVELASPGARPVDSYLPPSGALEPLPLTVPQAYEQWTFHGPQFQRITAIEGLSRSRMIGHLVPSDDVEALAGVRRPGWIIDPFVFDAALQLLLIWSRATNDKTALPSRFQAFTPHAPMYDLALTAYIDVEGVAGGHGIRSDVYFVDGQGRLVATLEGMEANCTAALNRLSRKRQTDGKETA